MEVKEIIQEIVKKIEKYDVITIYRHVGPDGDAIGSQNGLKELIKTNYPSKQVYCLGEDEEDYCSLCGYMDKVSDDVVASSLAITLDVPNKERIDDQRFLKARDLIKIDHHIFVENFGEPEWIDTASSSVCEMVTYIAIVANWKISTIGATSLYLGLTTDANRFMYSYTPRQFDCAKWLVENKADVETIYPHIYEHSVIDAKYHGYCESNFSLTPYGVAYNKIYPEIAKKYGVEKSHGSGLVNALANIIGVNIWAHFTENDDGTIRAEVRSKGIPVNVICNEFGGGGHIKAAGATLLNWDEVDIMLDKLDKAAFGDKPYHKEVTDALRIAKEASDVVMKFYNTSFGIKIKDDDSPVTDADKASDTFIRGELSRLYPTYGLLSEETKDDFNRLENDYVWIVDPIDGTKDFIAKDNEFCINIALAYKHEIVAGVIAVPAKKIYYYATKNGGAYKEENGIISQIHVSDATKDLVVAKSHFHTMAEEEKFLKQYSALLTKQVAVGSAYKHGLIAEGKVHVNYKLGNHTKEWDIAPGVIIVKEAGGVFLHPSGEEYKFNRKQVINEGGYIVLNRMNKEFIKSAEKGCK